MRYFIMDSHRGMKEKLRESLTTFFCEEKQLTREESEVQVGYLDWYEKCYGVKCFEAIATNHGAVVGYLICFRHPERNEEWYIGNVLVAKSHRRRGIATRLHDLAEEELKLYDAAEYVLVSIHRENEASIRMHELAGFESTNKHGEFASFYLDPEEIMYKKWLLNELPIIDAGEAKKLILPVWLKKEGATENSLDMLLKRCEETLDSEFNVVFCGKRIVGYYYYVDGEEEYFNSDFPIRND